MIDNFIQFVQKQSLFTLSSKLLVGVSGGVDSVALTHLLKQGGFNFSIAHCNFQLRAEESDKDEQFVQALSLQFNVPIYIRRFDTLGYAAKNHLSVQMAARELRYAWFEALCAQNGFDCIVVGHHLDDQKETFFIHLIRGSGISGLKAMKPKNGAVVRPLLFTGRDEIEAYVAENKLNFREDRSNTDIKYLRNKIRHQLIPVFNKIHPNAAHGFENSMRLLAENHSLYSELINEKRKQLMRQKNGIVIIDKTKLMESASPEALLFECISEYGFTGAIISEIIQCLSNQPGKIFYSANYRLVINRSLLEISKMDVNTIQSEYLIEITDQAMVFPLQISFEKQEKSEPFIIEKHPNIAYFDAEKLRFPLKIRKWQTGDSFSPFGMKGTKLVSDFFTDLHLTRNDKENVWLLCTANNEIIWVIGFRISQNYAVDNHTSSVLVVQHKTPN